MITLLILMGIDFIMGLLISIFWKKSNKSKSGALNSTSAWRGLVKKGVALEKVDACSVAYALLELSKYVSVMTKS